MIRMRPHSVTVLGARYLVGHPGKQRGLFVLHNRKWFDPGQRHSGDPDRGVCRRGHHRCSSTLLAALDRPAHLTGRREPDGSFRRRPFVLAGGWAKQTGGRQFSRGYDRGDRCNTSEENVQRRRPQFPLSMRQALRAFLLPAPLASALRRPMRTWLRVWAGDSLARRKH